MVSGFWGEFKFDVGFLCFILLFQKLLVIYLFGYSGVLELIGVMYYQSIIWLGMQGIVVGKDVMGGVVWFDYQWGGMFVGMQVCWDWLSVYMDGGEDLMFYWVLLLDGKVVQIFGIIID